MPHRFDSLEAFAKQFAGNWRYFTGYTWTRADIPDPEKWGVFYTRNSQSTPLEIVNAEHLKHLLWAYLHYKPKHPQTQKQVFEIRDRHFAAGLTEGFLIRAYNRDGTVSNACATLYDHLSALRDYPVADEEALDKLEAEIFADEWPEILKTLVAEFDGEHHPFYDGDCKFYINLQPVADTSGISALFLQHNPRQYWSSDISCFRFQHFLYDITDGRITFEEMFSAYPGSMTPPISAVLAECDHQEIRHDSPQHPESYRQISYRQHERERQRLAE